MPLDKPNKVSNDSITTPYTIINSDVAELGTTVATFYSGTTAQRPSVNVIVGDQFYNTQLKQLEIYTDNGWVANSTTPQAPTNVTVSNDAVAYGGTPAAIIKWVNATTGSPASTYTVTSTPGSLTATGASSPLTILGLTAGTSYTFNVTASNTYGSATSTTSNSLTAGTISQPPTGLIATAGNGTISLAFTAPSNTGAAPVTSYTVYLSSSRGNTTVTGTSSPIVISNLVNGLTYTLTVSANNNAGSSILSSSTTGTPTGTITASAFLVGGGGGGGGLGGGGGGGGVLPLQSVSFVPGTSYTVTVGGGGANVGAGDLSTSGGRGGDSSIVTSSGTIIAYGGGGGIAYSYGGSLPGPSSANGGSGGGGRNAPGYYGLGTAGQGNNAADTTNTTDICAGGGAGYSTAGTGVLSNKGGSGGQGYQLPAELTSLGGFSGMTYVGSGGGGGTRGSYGTGSAPGGTGAGAGSYSASTPGNGTMFGCGGGGPSQTAGSQPWPASGSGYQGVVVVRSLQPASSTTGVSYTSSANGYYYYTWLNNGNITFT
jgi:hypothetical protein